MLIRKALRKIFVTTMSIFIIMTIYLIPQTEKTLETNLEFEYITNLANSSIYLLDENNLLVKTKILLDNEDTTKDIKDIITNLTIGSGNIFPDNLYGVIPKNTKLNDIFIEEDVVTLDFSKELLNIDTNKSNALIESIVYSVTELDNINKVIITVENKELQTYPNSDKTITFPIDRSIGINNKYTYSSLNNLVKVVIYYQELINNDTYYVPVTKYLNDDKEKIDIIIEELTTSYIYEDNLSSILNENVKLTDKELTDDLLILDFNDALLENGELKEEVVYLLSYSVFANYDINTVSFRVNGKELKNVIKSDLI